MAYRVLALTVAAVLSLSSSVLAKEQCPVGQVYFRSKHICVSKGTVIARRIYHYRPPAAAKAKKTTIVHRLTRPNGANPAAAIPLPPVRLVDTGEAAAPPRDEAPVTRSGAKAPAMPDMARGAVSPYGALVPVPPAE